MRSPHAMPVVCIAPSTTVCYRNWQPYQGPAVNVPSGLGSTRSHFQYSS